MTTRDSPFYPLRAIVCGYEKSGTTLLNEVLRRHPGLDSGFECGMLLGDSPKDFAKFQPHYAFFKSGWQLSREDMHYIFAAEGWGECYRRARERSPLITDKNAQIFDKTPVYMLHLPSVLQKVPGIPCVVSVRDPRALMLSWAHWSGHGEDAEAWITANLDAYLQRYLGYAEGYCAALEQHGSRILLSRFEELCLEPQQRMRQIFTFLGLDFSEQYLNFSSRHFVYGNSVSAQYIAPYRGRLSASLCHAILDGTQRCAAWHYE
jgi:hypothetical protein